MLKLRENMFERFLYFLVIFLGGFFTFFKVNSDEYWEEEVFTAAEVATAIKRIKCGKAASEDEIRPVMLEALTEKGSLWLTRVCQVA